MTKVYITVGLAEMAAKIGDVSPEELELILIEMVILFLQDSINMFAECAYRLLEIKCQLLYQSQSNMLKWFTSKTMWMIHN